MTKAELLEQMATDAGISKTAASAALNSLVGNITMALKKKDAKVTLVGFGTFPKFGEKPAKGEIPEPVRRLKSRHQTPLSSNLVKNLKPQFNRSSENLIFLIHLGRSDCGFSPDVVSVKC